MNLDTATPTGKLILNVLGSIAQFERELMLERQREGIAKAKAEGKYKGRKPTARAKAEQVRELRKAGMGATEIGQHLRISRASVYRAIGVRAREACPSNRFESVDVLQETTATSPGHVTTSHRTRPTVQTMFG
jgi:DNA invertase Pin-like site-specific DNA recombinase